MTCPGVPVLCWRQVRRIKRGACEYDYVEIMACPGGCLNGGGQVAPAQGQTSQQLLDQLDTIYHDPEVVGFSQRPWVFFAAWSSKACSCVCLAG